MTREPRTMLDAWAWRTIPRTVSGRPVDIVALYRNGGGAAVPSEAAALFPAGSMVTLWIDVNATHPESCQVLDVEKGDAEPDQAPSWVKARAKLVHTSLPTLYCDRSTLTAVQLTCQQAGLKSGRDYHLWISTLDGTTTMNGRELTTIPGVVAVQVEGGPSAPYDRSVVYDPAWHPLAA